MEKDNRPLSPHLQVYKLPITAVMSILHRITGVGSVLGLVIVSIWLICTAMGRSNWSSVNDVMGNPFIVLLLFLWTLSLIYHFCNGIRHLIWDAGHSLEIEKAKKGGKIVIIATIVIQLVFWISISI